MLETMLSDFGLEGSSLVVELTETAILAEEPVTEQNLSDLRAIGVELALDDFGTGHSSLTRLRHHAFDIIKIDRSFVSGVVSSSDDRSITEAVVAMAHALDLWVVAEGVETSAQLEVVESIGCDAAQGYLLGRPAKITDHVVV